MSSKGILLSLGLLAVGFLLTGCGGGDGATDRPVLLPSGEVVASEALVAAPGRNFLVSADGASWEFRLWAMVSCRVLRPVAHSVEFFFQPGAEEADLWFRLFWDGREVGGGGGGHEVRGRIPPDLLTSGDHSLKVQRLYADRPVAEVRLERFGYRLGAEERLFLPAAEGRLRHLDAFLSVGVTGIDRQKYGGVLFDGPGSKSWPLSAAKPGKVEARIQNLSAQALRFTARLAGEVEDIEVPASARTVLEPDLTIASISSRVIASLRRTSMTCPFCNSPMRWTRL